MSIRARIAEDESDRRRASRVPVELDARMRELGANGVEARIVNISERGFMAVSEARFEVGSRVWLMLPGAAAPMPSSSGQRETRSARSSPSQFPSTISRTDQRSGREPRFVARRFRTPDSPA